MINRKGFVAGTCSTVVAIANVRNASAARDPRLAYVACEADDALAVVDLRARRAIRYVRVGSKPTAVVIDRTRLQAFVANFGANSVSVYDIPTATIVAAVETEGGPSAMTLAASGRMLYVCNVLSGSVSAIDPTTSRPVASVPVGDHPTDIATLGDDRAIVVNAGSGTLTVFRPGSRRRDATTIAVDRAASSLALSADGRTAFVGNARANTVTVVDITSATTIGTIGGLSEPRGLAVSGDRTLYVAEAAANSVAIVDIGGRAVIDRIAVGRRPYVVRPGPNGDLLALDYAGDSLSVVSPKLRRTMTTVTGLEGPLGVAWA